MAKFWLASGNFGTQISVYIKPTFAEFNWEYKDWKLF